MIISGYRSLKERQCSREQLLSSRVSQLTLFLKRLGYRPISLKNVARCFINSTSVEQLSFGSTSGLLIFACSVVVLNHAFLRRLIELTIGITRAHHHICLTIATRADIRPWLTFLDNFNVRAFFVIRSLGNFRHPTTLH